MVAWTWQNSKKARSEMRRLSLLCRYMTGWCECRFWFKPINAVTAEAYEIG